MAESNSKRSSHRLGYTCLSHPLHPENPVKQIKLLSIRGIRGLSGFNLSLRLSAYVCGQLIHVSH